jgi:hypothetical protein
MMHKVRCFSKTAANARQEFLISIVALLVSWYGKNEKKERANSVRRIWAIANRRNSHANVEKPQNPKRVLGLVVLVAWGGIEPPTQGFSILCSTD